MLATCRIEIICEQKRFIPQSFYGTECIPPEVIGLACTKGSITPYEAIMGKNAGISHIQVLVSKAHMHISMERLSCKFGERVQIGYCVGYTSANSYKIYDPKSGTVVVSRDVTLDGSTQVKDK